MIWDVRVVARPDEADRAAPTQVIARMQELFQDPGELVRQPVRGANLSINHQLEVRFETEEDSLSAAFVATLVIINRIAAVAGFPTWPLISVEIWEKQARG